MKLMRLVSLVLALSLVLSCLSIVPAMADDAVKLTICSPDNTFGISTDPELQEAVTKMLEEACGVDLEAIIPPIGSYNDKLETMMAGGDIPDKENPLYGKGNLIPLLHDKQRSVRLDDLLYINQLHALHRHSRPRQPLRFLLPPYNPSWEV